MKFYELQERSPEILERLLVVWGESVRATHGFLSEEVLQIKEYVPQALEQVEHLAVAETASGKLAGFLGAEKDRLEMLFLVPSERGKGLGRQFLQYGMEQYQIQELTVNE